jgi:hypothetical protein
MKKIRLLTSAEDTVLSEHKCGSDISSNTLCAIKVKKTSHTIQQNLVAKGKGLGLFIARGGSLIPVHAINWDQCSAERHVPQPGPMLRNEPGPTSRRHEPGPRPVIGLYWPAKPGQMAFKCWTKDPFSTSGRERS